EPALRAGELIRAVNGQRVLTVTQLADALSRAGSSAELEVVNGEGVRRTVRVPEK
ncbi:MAG: serine peptidase, partial [Phycisphaerae bacterium]|nr:serine peptidase [Phycisphaerae bacterium]